MKGRNSALLCRRRHSARQLNTLKKNNVAGTAGHSRPFAIEASLVRGIVDPGQAYDSARRAGNGQIYNG